MTFNVFITQPEMEEQGKSVFREDGWLPTTFVLKAHGLSSRSPQLREAHVPLGLLASLPPDREQEWQENVRCLAAQNGNPTVVKCGEDSGQPLVPLFQEPLRVGTGRQEMSVDARGPRRSEPQRQPGLAEPGATWAG